MPAGQHVNREKKEREKKRVWERDFTLLQDLTWWRNFRKYRSSQWDGRRENYTVESQAGTTPLAQASNMLIFAVEFSDVHYLLSQMLLCTCLRLSNSTASWRRNLLHASCVRTLQPLLPIVVAILSDNYTILLFTLGSWWWGIVLLRSPLRVNTRWKPVIC